MPKRLILLCLTLLLALLASSCVSARVLAEWTFTAAGTGWRDEAGSAAEVSRQGTLWPGSPNGLSLRSPALNLATEAFQAIEISVAFERPGQAHLLWQGEAFGRAQTGWQGPLPIEAPADGKVHELRLLPFWQNVKTIEALRLVGPPGTRLRLLSIRIIGSDLPPGDHTSWDFTSPAQAGQWLPVGAAAALTPSPTGLQVTLNQPSALIVSPSLDLPAFQYEWLSARISSRQPARVKLQWANSGSRGLHGPELQLRPGTHTYNVRCGVDRSWTGSLRGLAFEISSLPRTEVTLEALTLTSEPQGGPDLTTLYAGPLEPTIRAGRTFRLVWAVQNEGGQDARAVKLTATGGAGVTIADGALTVPRVDHGVPEVLTWLVEASAPATVVLQAEYDGKVLREEVKLPVEPALSAAPAQLPRPIPAAVEGVALAAHYHTPPPPTSGPAALDRALYRRPYLGDYDPTPEVMNWQIKWSLEHGINAWVLDVGDEAQAATLDAFLSSEFSRRMQFCLRWTAPVPSAEGARELFGERLAPVLAQPNYLRLPDKSGKPVVLIANALRRSGDGWGLSNLKELADTVPLTLVACLPLNAANADLLDKAGYSAAVDLHSDFPQTSSLLEDWQQAATAGTPHLLSLQPAWDEGMTPARLQTLLRIALLRARKTDPHAFPFIIAGDFNGQQSIEPRRPEGFQWLRAIADAVGVIAPTELTPEDLGVGPYDRPIPPPPSHWEFDNKDSWSSAMGLSVLRVAGGELTGRTDSDQPALFGGETMLDTRQFKAIIIGMSASAGSEGRLYWRTNLRKFNRDNSLPVKLIADGAMHEYRVDVGQAPGWRGYLEGLRLDPTNAAGATMALDYVRVVP